jgi:hypothetical protein
MILNDNSAHQADCGKKQRRLFEKVRVEVLPLVPLFINYP